MDLRFLHTGDHTGALNMAIDDVLLDEARAGGGPILRTYGWSPPAVSLGYGQRADEAIDIGGCRERGIDIVRRPTGGRAVLHWSEITYSFHCADGEGPAAHPLQEACRILGECLADGLRRSGIDVELSRGASPASGRRGACFASTSRWELTCGGRKLVGSAQRRTRGALLQHGSILAGPEHLRLAELIPPSGRGLETLAAHSTHLAECSQDPVDARRVVDGLAAGFGQVLGMPVHERPLTGPEEARAEILARDTYGSEEHALRQARPAGQPA
jgi:lipoate-protein ligase A